MSDTDPYGAPTESKNDVENSPKPEEKQETELVTMSDTNSTVEEKDEVPEGTVNSILEWVGEDVDRAERALAKEKESPNKRSTLIRELEDIIDG